MQLLAGLASCQQEEVLWISLASLGSTNILHIVMKWMNHQVCIHILLDGIYSSAELWIPLLGLVAKYSLLSCGSQLGQELIMQPLAGLDFLPAREGSFADISGISWSHQHSPHRREMDESSGMYTYIVRWYLQLC